MRDELGTLLAAQLVETLPVWSGFYAEAMDFHDGLLHVGSPQVVTDGVTAGAVHVYSHCSEWTEIALIHPDPVAPSAWFGGTLAAWPGRLLVGSRSEREGALRGGAARMYEHSLQPGGPREPSSAASGVPLLVRRSGAEIVLSFEDVGSAAYNVYRGDLGSWYSHASLACDASTAPAGASLEARVIDPGPRSYLLVTSAGACESGSGVDSTGAAHPSAVLDCPP